MDKSTTIERNLPPVPGGRKGKDIAVNRHEIRDLYFAGRVTEAARVMRAQGYTIKQTASYLNMTVQRVTPLISDIPSPNIAKIAEYVSEAGASPLRQDQQQAGVDRFNRALAERDMEFFRGMDDVSACNRHNQRRDTLLWSNDPIKLHRCLMWLETFWKSTKFTLHVKVIGPGPERVPEEWVAWWSEQMGIDRAAFDKPQIIISRGKKDWHPVDKKGTTHGLLELRYRSTELTQNILGVWAAKAQLMKKLGLSRVSMANLVLGELG